MTRQPPQIPSWFGSIGFVHCVDRAVGTGTPGVETVQRFRISLPLGITGLLTGRAQKNPKPQPRLICDRRSMATTTYVPGCKAARMSRSTYPIGPFHRSTSPRRG